MMVRQTLLVLAALLPAALGADGAKGVAAAKVTPIQKVISMMEGMLSKCKDEKHAEEVAFAEKTEWCNNLRFQKEKAIAEGKDQITQLSADIDKAASDAEVLGSEIKELNEAADKDQLEADAAKAQRQKEKADFDAQNLDYSESIDACERAIAVLKAKSADVPQSLAQLKASKVVPAQAKAMITSFLAMDSASDAGVPEANAYEFQSGGVIDLLEKLTARFKDERLALQKAELNAKANYEQLMQQLRDNIDAAKDTAGKKTAARAGRLDDHSEAKGDLAVTEKAKAEDEKTLDETNAECSAASKEFEENQVTRAAEVEAIQKAIEIISSDDVKGAGETHLPQLLQTKTKKTALAQLRSVASTEPAARKRASAYLLAQASKLNSRYLSVMAARVQEDPFGKVKKMIKDLIVKLMEEANEEADHHAYCTTELATNKQTREDKSAEVEDLSAEADELTAVSTRLGNEIAELSDSIAEIRASQAEAQKIRTEEKGANTATVEDAKAAQVAVEQAIEVLRTFYESAAEGSSLLQGSAKGSAKKAKHQEPYKGMQAASGGILGMLEVILSDFARLETETSTAEDQGANAFEKYMDESTQDAEVKATEKEHKESKKQRTEEQLRSTKKELGLTQEELDAAMSYYDKLKTDCVDTGLSYDDRKKARAEEIESLKQALQILNGEDLA